MPEQKWTMHGEYMESCNCDYLCPCVYTNPQGPATFDHCIAVLVFRIEEGNCGGTRLDGLKFALVIRSGRVMADGNWVFAGVVDDQADPAQRQALAAIVGGEAGGPPGMIREHLVGDFRGVQFAPIEFAENGLTRRPRSLASPASRSRASRRATAAANLITSTTPATRPTAAWRWPGPRKPMCTASASIWISRARATTATSRHSPGPPSRAVQPPSV